jgi:hypothetical protein
MSVKGEIKSVLGRFPAVAELDFNFRRRGTPPRGFSLDRLDAVLADWQAQAAASPFINQPGKRVFIFATQRYWIEHASLFGLALAGQGHQVDFAYLPYADWRKPVNAYDLQQHGLYAKRVMDNAAPLLNVSSLLDYAEVDQLPVALETELEAVSIRDCQYTDQVEAVDQAGDLYQFRLARNRQAAAAAYRWLKDNTPDVVIVPNGLIMEFGAVYQVGRQLGIPVVSYEFGEQRDRIWFSQDRPVMIQDTSALWAASKDKPFSDAQLETVRDLFQHRQGAALYQNFYRKWQDLPAEGGAAARAKLGLDERPVVLLAANVVGDSLTLGRQVFTESMTEWLVETLRACVTRPKLQLVLRVHPGERNLEGPSVADLVAETLPDLPENIHIVRAGEPVNTYDLIALADLGLAYTTTVGLEMAMSGVPVIVVGETHYRDRGFTFDPTSWDEYNALLDQAINRDGLAISKAQVRQAWHYAYRFFFDYPQPFPWHLIHMWEHVEQSSLSKVLTEEGLQTYQKTFDYLIGEPVPWAK